MEGSCVRAIGTAVSSYLRGLTNTTPSAFAVIPMKCHEDHGHLSERCSRVKGIPYPKNGCPICHQANMKRSPSTGKKREKCERPLQCVFCDIKVSSVADRHGRTMCLGLVDSCTGMSWMYGIDAASTAEVIRVLDHWRVQKCGGYRTEELVINNGTCFTSKAMQSYESG